MNQTDAALISREISRAIILKNENSIRNLHLDDLFYIEQDLEFYEKVSLVFLLFANDRNQYKCILQQLLALSLEQTKQTDLLRNWANTKTDWKNILLEALCLIQAKNVIHNLGLDFDELNERYLPANKHIASHIHLIVKLLYFVCEQLTVKQCKRLIDSVTSKYPSDRNFVYAGNGEHLEIYLFHWLSENVIDIGEKSDDGNRPCKLDAIIQWMKEEELDSPKETIIDVVKRFNLVEEPQNPKRNNAYKIEKKSAGIILIINQKNFYFDTNPELQHLLPSERLLRRDGTDRDANKLEEVFKSFGYVPKRFNNLLHWEILNEVRKVVNDSVRYDSVIVCILSHGCEGVIYGANSIPVQIDYIKKLMISDRLIGKPKILVIQAWQGEEEQRAVKIDYEDNELRTDGPSMRLPVYSDLLTCVSTVEGFLSYRNPSKGSWFIQTLCNKVRENSVKEYANQKHFIDILTMVIREVTEKRGLLNQCMVPTFSSTLRLDLYFPAA